VRDLVLMTRIFESHKARGHIRDDAIAHVCATPRATTPTSTRISGTRSARARPPALVSWWRWRSVVWVAGAWWTQYWCAGTRPRPWPSTPPWRPCACVCASLAGAQPRLYAVARRSWWTRACPATRCETTIALGTVVYLSKYLRNRRVRPTTLRSTCTPLSSNKSPHKCETATPWEEAGRTVQGKGASGGQVGPLYVQTDYAACGSPLGSHVTAVCGSIVMAPGPGTTPLTASTRLGKHAGYAKVVPGSYTALSHGHPRRTPHLHACASSCLDVPGDSLRSTLHTCASLHQWSSLS
jgi:hypothetical protein